LESNDEQWKPFCGGAQVQVKPQSKCLAFDASSDTLSDTSTLIRISAQISSVKSTGELRASSQLITGDVTEAGSQVTRS
jgi:hypothetical protein